MVIAAVAGKLEDRKAGGNLARACRPPPAPKTAMSQYSALIDNGRFWAWRRLGLAIGKKDERCARSDYSLTAVLKFSRSWNCPRFTPARDRCGSGSMQPRSTQPTSGSATARAPDN